MIVVFGSLNVDMVMKTEKLPHPGDTVLCPSYDMIAGGKGANQALAASRAGAKVHLFGRVGKDGFGKIALSELASSSVILEGVAKLDQATTGCATICVDRKGENIIVVASGANAHAREKDIPDSILSSQTTVLLQMETSAEENWQLIRRAKKRGARVILNLAPAQPVPVDVLESLDILVLNEGEASLLALYLGFEVISPKAAVRQIVSNFDIICIVTLGKEGVLLCTPEGTWAVPGMEIEAVDTTGAGDDFTGVFAAGLDAGLDILDALHRATVAGGLTCLKKGAQPSLPFEQDIESNLQKVQLPRRIA